MLSFRSKISVTVLITSMLGCEGNTDSKRSKPGQQLSSQQESGRSKMDPSELSTIKAEKRNAFGYAKISSRKEDVYYEGIVDESGEQIVPLSTRLLVNEITGKLALIQFERKFLFVPLDGGFFTEEDLAGVNGFQYAQPHRCGLAMVCVNDSWFYINSDCQRAFDANFEFAESFHQDRALVMSEGKHRIIGTNGNTIADLNYDQVSPQSEWCWQVSNKVNEKYKSGFIDLDGKQITDLDFDDVGYYDPEVKRIWVRKDRRYGFLDEYAKTAIPLKYDFAEVFNRGKAKVLLDGRTFFIDPNGIEVPE
jgi:hypothetical protein